MGPASRDGATVRTAFATTTTVLVWVVSGHNGENLIRAEGTTEEAA
jgi:hypothetical protein